MAYETIYDPAPTVLIPRDLAEGWLEVDHDRQDALVGGVPAGLLGIEYALLAAILRQPSGAHVEQLVRAAGGSHEDAPLIRMHVLRLQSKLESLGVTMEFIGTQSATRERIAA